MLIFVIGKKNENGTYKITNVDANAVGLKLLTKKPGAYEPWNIIDQYKHPEGDIRNRASLLSLEEGDCTFQWILEKTKVGEDLVALVEVNTTSGEDRTIKGKFVCLSTNYRGNKKGILKTEDFTARKVPCTLRIQVSPQEYGNALSDSSYPFQFEIFAQVDQSSQNHFSFKQIVLGSPDVQILIPDEIKKNVTATAQIRFTNPLDRELTGVTLSVDGANLLKSQKINTDNILPSDTFFASIDFHPTKRGTYLLQCQIQCRQLSHNTGFVSVTVK